MTSPVTVHGGGSPDSADALGAHLLGHLRGALGPPELEFAEPPSPVIGGFDTRIFAYRVRGAEAAWSGPLILRALARKADPLRVLRERAIQNAVAALGYPAPRVVDACTDPAVLGGAFLAMERLPGRVLPEERVIGMASVLASLPAAARWLVPLLLRGRRLHACARPDGRNPCAPESGPGGARQARDLGVHRRAAGAGLAPYGVDADAAGGETVKAQSANHRRSHRARYMPYSSTLSRTFPTT
jgi:hypothetical protein